MKVLSYQCVLHLLGVIAFVIVKEGVELDEQRLCDSLKDLIKIKIGSFAIPNMFLVCCVCMCVYTCVCACVCVCGGGGYL